MLETKHGGNGRLKDLRVDSAIHGSEAELHRLLEKIPAGAYTCDRSGLITYFNQRAADLWGRAPKLNDPEDRFCGSFKLCSKEGAPIRHDQCWVALALQNDEEYNAQEVIVERPDGERVTVLAHVNPIHDESGSLIGAVNILVDISERKRTEDLLREADRSKDEFLATLAHELRNPLAPVRNAIQILQAKGSPTPESQWALQVIDRQMRQMTRLIDDLLDISRITRTKLELRKERVDLREVIRAAVETSRPLIEAERHELTLSVPAAPIFLNADTTRLAQAFANLLNNAAKYTERKGHVWLTAQQEGSSATVTIRDSGIGIAPEVLPSIFEPFSQAVPSAERSRSGLGIGLTLVKRLVDMHGGTIEAKSEGAGKGSTFSVRLPLAPDWEQPPNPGAAEDSGSVPDSTLRVLVVDDNRDSATTLGMLLRLAGNQVRHAYDGHEALALASEFRPDVIVLDIGLPKLSGYEVASAIRQQPWGRKMFLIAVTGWGQESDKRSSMEVGFDHHMVKPVDPVVLMKLMASLPGRELAEGNGPDTS